MTNSLTLRNARTTSGAQIDLVCGDGLVVVVGPAGSISAPVDGDTIDLAGWLLLPAPVEPHAHLDKVLTADIVRNPAGDLDGAIHAWRDHTAHLTAQDVIDRATIAVRRMVAAGTTTIRTHVGMSADFGLRFVDAICEVRDRLAGIASIEVVGLVAPPISGIAGADGRAMMRDALDRGVDVVGGAPHVDPDPFESTKALFDLAVATGRPIDLHTDETLDPAFLGLADLAAMVGPGGFGPGVTASHCVSLGMQHPDVQAAVAGAVADAGISVVTLPQTNLFLQARGVHQAPARGLTAVAPLLAAGVNVAAGADNLQDPFNTVGRGDAFETAALMVMAGHLSAEQAWNAVSAASSTALGGVPAAAEVGCPADFLAVPSASLRAAIADAPPDRIVVHRGRVVARTHTSQWIADPSEIEPDRPSSADHMGPRPDNRNPIGAP